MGQFLFFAEHKASGQADAPTAAQIEATLQAIPVVAGRSQRAAQGLPDMGAWVGSARVTRQSVIAVVGPNRLTRVAWLYSYGPWPSTWSAAQQAQSDHALRDYIRLSADQALQAQSTDWQPSQILSYDPATNGSVAWWASGQAARTHTRDAFDLNQQFGGTSTVENPTGPQLATPPPDLSPSTAISSTLQSSASALKTVAWIAAGGVVLYFVWPFLSGVRRTASRGLSTRRERVSF